MLLDVLDRRFYAALFSIFALTLLGSACGARDALDGSAGSPGDDCVIDGNTASQGGADLGASRGTLVVSGGTVRDVLLTGLSEATFTDVTVTGDLRLRENAALVLSGGSVAGEVTVRGTTTRTPWLVVDGTHPAHPVDNDPSAPGAVQSR